MTAVAPALPTNGSSLVINPKAVLLGSFCVSLGFLLVDCLIAYAFGGVMHWKERMLIYALWELTELGGLGLGVLLLLGRGFWYFLHWYSREGLVFCAAAILLIPGPVIARRICDPILVFTERRDLNRLGVATLRSEAAALIAANKATLDRENDYVGWREIPREKLPETIGKASTMAVQVLVDEESVFIFTETRFLGTRKCGYIITPPGSKYRPGGINYYLREIEDGVFYVVEGT